MRVLYFEPFCGISGDMTLGALVDLGVDLELIRTQLALLPVRGYQLSARKVTRGSIQAVKVDVEIEPAAGQGGAAGSSAGHGTEDHGHRTFASIRAMLASSGLSERVKERAIAVFERLAVAEGRIHGCAPDEVHFHEVGAIDSIVDIVGSVLGIDQLMPARILSAPVNLGRGTVQTRHGVLPVPSPATEAILVGVPVYGNDIEGELTTPTGATLLATLVERFGPRPLLKTTAAGYGAGTRDIRGAPNVLRVTLGEEVEALEPTGGSEPRVAVLEATIDDMSPQTYAYFQERALEAGALDVYASPIFMKKNRPALAVTVLAAESDVDRLSALVFTETTTIGIRYTVARRRTLERRFVEVTTEYGAIRIKVALLEGRAVNFAPEFEDCRRLARQANIPLKKVQAAAVRSYLETAPEA